MKLPNREKAIVAREKVVDYLLSFVHKDGRAKAEFFIRFGFTSENWEVLADALKSHADEHEIKKQEVSPFGMRYIIEGGLAAPDGQKPKVRAVWFAENETAIPRLATAYPMKGKRE
ncbi:MAG TPA: hypothetical protein VK892_06885 [Pyrinomonadaceae bacterium]|nr:hypothetical protein [Pyrinomonadaceae bacterium]